jgi:hypothetical protein
MASITDKQMGFAISLLSKRLVTLGLPDIATARKTIGLDDMTVAQAKTLISRLLEEVAEDPDPNLPEVVANAKRHGFPNNRPGVCPTCHEVVVEGSGYYFLAEGSWEVHHKLNECPEPSLFDEQGPAGLDLSHVPSGLYAVPGDPDRLKVKINWPDKGKWAGWLFVNDAAVYGWQGRLGRAKPGDLYVGKSMDKLAVIAADPMAAMAEYGHITGTCGKCGRPLEDEQSVARGIGPVCYKRMEEG